MSGFLREGRGWIHRRVDAVAFSLLFLVPLAAPPGFATEAPRLAAALLVLALLWISAAVRAARSREGPVRADPWRTAVLLLAAANGISFAAGPPSWEGFWPMATLAGGLAAGLLAAGETLQREYFRRVGPTLLSTMGLAVSLTGMAQALRGGPAVALEGNTNYSGTLAAMLLPVTAAAVWAAPSRGDRVLRTISFLALGGLLWLSESRAGLAGAAAGGVVVAGVLGVRRGVRAAALAAAGILLVVAAPLALRSSRYLSPERRATGEVRLGIWKGAGALAIRNPVLGTGPGNFAARFPPHRDPGEFLLSGRPAWPDLREVEDAHSIWFQMGAETGLVGGLAFLLVLYVAARLWRYYVRTVPDPGDAAILAGLGGGAVAFLVSGCFNTLTLRVSHTILFWIFLGGIRRLGRLRDRGGPAAPGPAARAAASAVFFLAAAGVAGMLAWMDRRFETGMRLASASERAALFEKALRVHPPYWPMRYELGRARAALGFLRESAAEYRKVLESRPHHLGALNNLGGVLANLPGGEEEAERHFRHALQVAPYYYLTHYNWGILEARRSRLPEARAAFTEALRWNPGHAGSCYSLGVVHLLEGDVGAAREWFLRARDLGMDVAACLRREHPRTLGDPRLADLFR